MARESKGKNRPGTSSIGPIKPDTPLYRLLEMIARKIAKPVDINAPPERKRRRKRQ